MPLTSRGSNRCAEPRKSAVFAAPGRGEPGRGWAPLQRPTRSHPRRGPVPSWPGSHGEAQPLAPTARPSSPGPGCSAAENESNSGVDAAVSGRGGRGRDRGLFPQQPAPRKGRARTVLVRGPGGGARFRKRGGERGRQRTRKSEGAGLAV